MPPRSLRTGRRTPNPGAVHKGCPRPKTLRGGSFATARSPFGDGQYTGNIIQGGVPLQPQDYLLDGVTPLNDCIVYTSTATVAPDATTGAAAFTCRNIVGIGPAARLSASTNCKGLLGFVRGTVALRGGAHLHMDKLGKAGNFGDLSPADLLPARVRGRVSLERLLPYRVRARGAEGAPSASGNFASNSGLPASSMQTGGGGTGVSYSCSVGRGGCGGPCCGGAGSGGGNGANSIDAGDYGGPGGPGAGSTNGAASGGSGDPAGPRSPTGPGTSYPGNSAGGGLVELFAHSVDIGLSCVISADGANGGGRNAGDSNYLDSTTISGGGAGGGCIVIVTKPGGYTNSGTVRAAGGTTSGGTGSVNIFELAA